MYVITTASGFGIATLVSPAGRYGLYTPYSVLIPFRKVAVPRARKVDFPILLFFPFFRFIPTLQFLCAARPTASPSRPFGSR
jgi:hypothetical protein